MKFTPAFILTITCTALLSSCATTDNRVPTFKEMLAQSTGQNGRACLQPQDIRGYGVLDHDIVSIDAGRRYYLATILPGCTNLDMSMRAMFRGDSFQICGGRMDKMITRKNNCTIGQIFEFENREAAFSVYHEVADQRDKLKSDMKK